ncbi:butyrophilin subfamily 3 member A2-like isoform X2 [Centropristis striata]|nr:butyrophilin subfamily 3 member A2-like isoform X2 [Centropristis striata]
MFPTKDRPLTSLRTASVLQHIAVFLLLTHSWRGESKKIDQPRQVIVMVGDDIVLPCNLETAMNAVSMTIEWGRLDLDPRFIFLWHEGQELQSEQNEAYKGRSSLSISNMKHGDISLKLSPVKISDNGTYRCHIPKLSQQYFVELLVGAISSPAISLAGIDKTSSGVLLDCESSGWYPEPEVLWLDGEGKLLSAGPTETVRGPDDLYTVSSRVTVEKRHSNSFTCRVHQKDTNHTTETHITVPEDFFMVSSSGCAASTTISVLFAIMFVLAVGCIVWKWRQNKSGIKTQNKSQDEETRQDKDTTEQQGLMEARVREQLMADNKKMKEELQKKETDMTQVIKTLQDLENEMKNELKMQNEKHIEQQLKAVKQVEMNEEKINSVEKEIREKEGDLTVNRGLVYLQLKETITQNNWYLSERKEELQKLHMATDNLIQMTYNKIKTITGKEEKED